MTITGKPGPRALDLLEQIEAAAARHADVGHQHIGRVGAQRRQAHCPPDRSSVAAMPLPFRAFSSTQRIDASSSTNQTCSGFAFIRMSMGREIDEYGSPGRAVELDEAAVAAHEILRDTESEAGAVGAPGDERIKNRVANLRQARPDRCPRTESRPPGDGAGRRCRRWSRRAFAGPSARRWHAVRRPTAPASALRPRFSIA